MFTAQQEFEAARSFVWANPDPKLCRCHGTGGFVSNVDTHHKCPFHAPACECDPEWDPNGCDVCCPELADVRAKEAAEREAEELGVTTPVGAIIDDGEELDDLPF